MIEYPNPYDEPPMVEFIVDAVLPREGTKMLTGKQLVGPCRECGQRTDLVVLFAGKMAFLCAPCGAAIRSAS